MGVDGTKAGTEAVRVLIVEDNEVMRFSLQRTLEQVERINVVAAASTGLEGVNKAKSEQPDIVLMDIGLPEINGIEATRRIKSEGSEISVIMLTSSDEPEKVFASLAAGADGYCVKTISPEELIDVIERVHEGFAYLDPTIASHVVRVYDMEPVENGDDDEELLDESSVIIIEELSLKEKARLTQREVDVLNEIVQKKNDEEIAATLGIKVSTVRGHIRRILAKLSVADRTQAALQATEDGLV